MSKIGRNIPCPCGSGKKSKKCCGTNNVGNNNTLVLAEQYNERGNFLADQGQFHDAIIAYKMALTYNPELAGVYNNLGLIYKTQGLLDDAISCYRQAIAFTPAYAGAYLNLGNALREAGNLNEAIASYQTVLSLTPDSPGAYFGFGSVWLDKGKRDEAIRCFRKSFAIEPDAVVFNGIVMNMLYEFLPTAEELFATACEFGGYFETPLMKQGISANQRSKGNERIRIGFVSADLRNHAVGYFLQNILKHLNRESLQLYAYMNHLIHDVFSERIRPYFEKWTVVAEMTDEVLAEIIREDKIDILVDLSGHSADNRLLTFARKPAPVQVTWLGYPATSGLKSMDYILADPITLPPEEERYYTEKAWRLPETYVCFSPPDFDLPTLDLPANTNGHLTFGSCNNPLKINDEVISCWSDILFAIPESHLLLNYRTMNNESTREVCRKRFLECGVDSDRLRFSSGSSRIDYLTNYRMIDFALDPFPYGGMTTTCEALWMGVPTLTLRMTRGMYAHSGELIMKSVGLDDWVTSSVEEYRDRAIAFAGNPEWLATLRMGLRDALLSSPLCAAERFARNLEDAFHGMVRMNTK